MSSLITKYVSRAATNDLGNKPETFTRYNGGYDVSRRHPFITGYWVCLVKIPDAFKDTKIGDSIPQFLCSTAESFTPPTRTLTKSDIIGFGGVKKYVITGQDIGNTFNITFREYSYLPIYNIFSAWTTLINPYSGHISNNYKGQIAIGLLKPIGIWSDSDPHSFMDWLTGKDPDESYKKAFDDIFFFEGVVPENDPIGSFDGNIESNDGKTIDMTFSYDSVLSGAFNFDAFFDELATNNVLNLIPNRDLVDFPVGGSN